VHVPAHKKLMAPVPGYTIEVVNALAVTSFLLSLFLAKFKFSCV
jgi:hypothetical protein